MRYCFPTKDYLSYEKLASVLDPSPTSAPSLWRRVFDRQAVLAVFYQLDYAADVPRVSKCIRIRKERNSSLQYVLVPTVYLHGQELSDSHVSAILGSAVLRKPEDVTRLLESLDTAGMEEEDGLKFC
ncbi:hypothetical protein RvY_18390-3 [Ramazzottius varieornatus]|uniref:Uncharacterized protein n=1 Tax=Ramazzottius varieornatus TaxID=947166 RepID=A0A1D1W8V0_RAMVA|nr:hypothetical protein RvY_18390-3 [Ramazzottius varieornatus]